MTFRNGHPNLRVHRLHPVRNIWLLLLYASRLYREPAFHAESNWKTRRTTYRILVAESRTSQTRVERRLRRNLSHGYQRRAPISTGSRGRIDLFRTERDSCCNGAELPAASTN